MLTAEALNERQDIVLKLLLERDQEGMRQLFKYYGGALMTIIHPIVLKQEVAEEVLHDVLLKVWNNIDSYDNKKSRFFTWMARIARNAAIDKTRSKHYRQSRKTDQITESVDRDVTLSHTPSFDHIGITALLDKLDEKHRVIIELLYLKDYTQSEAAEALNLPLGTVKTRSRRALQQLREVLQHEMLWLLLFSITSNSSFPT